jgi:hypothetical protein
MQFLSRIPFTLRRLLPSPCYTPHSLDCCDMTVQFLPSKGLILCLLHASKLFRCSSQCCVSLEYSVSSHRKVLAALTLQTSRVVILLGAVFLCYDIIDREISTDNYTSRHCFPLLQYNRPRNIY